MNKCPQCLNILSASVEVCKTCGFSLAADVTETLVAFGLNETEEQIFFY